MGEVTVEVYDPAILRAIYPEWPALNDKEKLATLRSGRAEPIDEGTEHNVTCVGLHEYLPDVLNPEKTPPDQDVEYLAIGDDDTTAPATGNRSLNNEIGRVSITDAIAGSTSVDYEVFVDSSEFNGETFAEAGLATGAASDSDARLLNHSLVSPTVDKTNSKTVIFTATLTFDSA